MKCPVKNRRDLDDVSSVPPTDMILATFQVTGNLSRVSSVVFSTARLRGHNQTVPPSPPIKTQEAYSTLHVHNSINVCPLQLMAFSFFFLFFFSLRARIIFRKSPLPGYLPWSSGNSTLAPSHHAAQLGNTLNNEHVHKNHNFS